MFRVRILFLSLVCLGVVGCSSGGSGPKLAKADGTVTFKGKPLAGATVMFLPDKGPLAMGVTDKDGKFVLSTGPNRGVVVGPAKATVTANAGGTAESMERPKTPAESEAYMKKAAEMQQSIAQGKGQEILPTSLIPDKYGKSDTSGLTYTIKENGDNHFTINLAE